MDLVVVDVLYFVYSIHLEYKHVAACRIIEDLGISDRNYMYMYMYMYGSTVQCICCKFVSYVQLHGHAQHQRSGTFYLQVDDKNRPMSGFSVDM